MRKGKIYRARKRRHLREDAKGEIYRGRKRRHLREYEKRGDIQSEKEETPERI